MRYIIQKSPLIEKFYILDTVDKKLTTETGYDIIVSIVEDKYAIVGYRRSYNVDYHYYNTYDYKLIDVNGREVFNEEFEFVYPTDSYVFCKIKNLPVNKLTYLGNYLWNQKDRIIKNKYPYFYIDDEKAIVKGEYWEDRTDPIFPKFGHIYQLLNNKGDVLQDDKIECKERVSKILQRYSKSPQQPNYVYIDFLADRLDKKWAHINEIAERTNDKYYNLGSIQINGTLVLTNVHLGFAWNKYLLVYKDDNEYDRSYHHDRKIINRANNCLAILNDSYKLLYYSADGFKVNTRTFIDRIIIGEEYIMDFDGSLFSIPKDIIFSDDTCDRLGYLQIEKDDKLGYMNNRGEVVIPTIFPKDVLVGIDEDAANESWQEYQQYATDSVSDAYEGDSDARWNTD